MQRVPALKDLPRLEMSVLAQGRGVFVFSPGRVQRSGVPLCQKHRNRPTADGCGDAGSRGSAGVLCPCERQRNVSWLPWRATCGCSPLQERVWSVALFALLRERLGHPRLVSELRSPSRPCSAGTCHRYPRARVRLWLNKPTPSLSVCNTVGNDGGWREPGGDGVSPEAAPGSPSFHTGSKFWE